MLRFMAWLCLRNDDYQNSQMVIVTGPNQELAIKLIKRMKGLFADKLGVTFDSKETVLELNGCEHAKWLMEETEEDGRQLDSNSQRKI